jgi:hypothetical protein
MRKVAFLLACLIALQLLVGTLTVSAGYPTGGIDGRYVNPGYVPTTTGYGPSYYPYPYYTGYSNYSSPYFNTYASGYYDPCATCSYLSARPPYLPVPFWWEYPYYPSDECYQR